MKVSSTGKKNGNRNEDLSYSGNVIIFPKKNRKPDVQRENIADPGLSIIAGDGRILDKLGMSGDECCYILPPHVTFIHLLADAPTTDPASENEGVESLIPVRVILSESAAVTEIGMGADEDRTYDKEDASKTHWVEPGRTLYLLRHAPEYVAMLSVKFARKESVSGQF